MLVIGL
nr:unnamed protein product [Callosobruchus analis]